MAARRRAPAPPPRLWPAFLVVALAAAALAWTWARPASAAPAGLSREGVTTLVALGAALLLAAWWLLYSRTRFFTRLAVTLALVAFAGTASLLVEYRGLSAERVPQFGWRRHAPSPDPAPTPSPTPVSSATPPSARHTTAEGDEGPAVPWSA